MEALMRAALMNAVSASMLAMVVAAVGLMLSRRPAILHCLWLIVLLKLLAPPMLEVPLLSPLTAEPTFEVEAASLMIAFESDSADPPEEATPPFLSAVEVEAPAPTLWLDPATLWILLGIVWAVGSTVTAACAMVRVRRFQRLLADAEPAEPCVEAELAALAARMDLRRPPEVVFIDGRLTPLLWAVGRPRLVIPRALWKGLDGRRRTLLLTHELAHLRRGDHWLRFLELAVTVVYWWLPVVWWVRRAFRDVEEQCCDAWVVWMFPDEARTYAETLLDTVDFLNPVAKSEPLLASGFGKVHHLRRRLTMVMLGTTPRALGWSGTLGALVLAGVLLPMSPSWAQKSDTPAESSDKKSEVVEEVFISVTDDDPNSIDPIGKFEVKVDGKDEVGDVLVLSDYLGDLFAAAPGDDDKKSDDAKPDKVKSKKRKEVRVVVKGSGLPKGGAEAIQKAIEKLTLQIKEREGKQPEGEDREAEIQALKSAIDQLKKIAETHAHLKIEGGAETVDVRPSERVFVMDGPNVLTEDVKGGVVTIRRSDDKQPNVIIESRNGDVLTADRLELNGAVSVTSPDGKPSAGDPKQIEEVRKQIAELGKQMAAKQKQLVEAHHRLAELQGWGSEFKRGELRVNGIRHAAPGVVTARGIARVPDLMQKKEDARLDALEKKLSKVLEELDGLKKHKTDGEDKKR